jgi:glycosyltransferase involved in cell wall biosynthesis
MRSVYLKGRSQGGLHSLYQELIKYPPDGYQILVGKLGSSNQRLSTQQQSISVAKKRQRLIYDFDEGLQNLRVMRDIWYEAKTLSYVCIKRIESSRALLESNVDLVYFSQQLTFAKLPWVVDFEYANALVNYSDIRLVRRFVQNHLASKYCKKILPWSDYAKRTLYQSLDCKSFEEKIETVHFGVSRKDFVKKTEDDKLRLLFVGSTNLFNFMNFEKKGGFEVMDAFLELNKKYEGLELIIRSWVPPEIKEKYSNNPDIKILDSPISKEALANLYVSSDIFVFPGHSNLGMAIPEAMSYGLPVIACAVYDVPEAVEDMKTGILITPPPKLASYILNIGQNRWRREREIILEIRKYRPWLVKQIVEKASLLIEDRPLRRRIGQEARRLIEEGEFSIKNRNQKLKRIFDEAIENN